MNRRVMLSGLVTLPCLGVVAAANEQAGPGDLKLRALESGTQIKIFCVHVAGEDACAYLETEGSHFYLRFSYGHWSTRVDLGQGEITVPLGPAKLTVTVSNLQVTASKITFHLKVVAKVKVPVLPEITVTLFDKDVSVNKPLLLAEYTADTWKPGAVILTVEDGK